MNQQTAPQKRVVVIGGGITGLAAAHRLVELQPAWEVILLEASSRLGGVLDTVRRDGFLIERSADNFIASVPWGVDLCARIGLADQLIRTSSQQRNAMVVHRGRLVRLPAGFMLMAPSLLWPLVSTPLLSPAGKLRLFGEMFVPRRKDNSDESLADFARRRLGREAFERIVQPLVGGIYTADPEKLSLQATLPRFVEMESRFGSLIRGARRGRTNSDQEVSLDESRARYGLFVTLRDGMSSLVDAIAAKLPAASVRLGSRVERLSRRSMGGWSVRTVGDAANRSDVGGNSPPPLALSHEGKGSDAAPATLDCDAIIVAVGAPAAAGLLEPVDCNLAGYLRRIEYAGTSVVTMGFRRDQIEHPLDSFGFVVPAIENRKILAGSFSSVKFAGRAPDGAVLVRVFIGGACQSELADLPDGALQAIAEDELRSLLGTRGAPMLVDIARWPRSMPQYHVGHCELVIQIEQATAELPNLALAGNAYHGVGIPNCIHSGEEAAERAVASLAPG